MPQINASQSIPLAAGVRVQASSTMNTGMCAPAGLCAPSLVLDGKPVTRWVSDQEFTNSTSSCRPQWLEFDVAAASGGQPTPLSFMTIEYGDFSWSFDGGNGSCPDVLVSTTTSTSTSTTTPAAVALTLGVDYTCATSKVLRGEFALAEESLGRLDSIYFAPVTTSVASVRVRWRTLAPMSSYVPRWCLMDVVEVAISRLETSTASPGNTTATPASVGIPGGSGLSTTAAWVLAVCLVAAAVVTGVLVARRHNVEKRRRAALAMRLRRWEEESSFGGGVGVSASAHDLGAMGAGNGGGHEAATAAAAGAGVGGGYGRSGGGGGGGWIKLVDS